MAEESDKPKFLDFQLMRHILQLIKITNQMKQMDNMRRPEFELEQTLLGFACLFKNHVLTDSKIISIASNIVDRENGEDEGAVVDSFDNIYNETEKAYVFLA